MNPKLWIVIGALFAGGGVAIGAYHAHGLRAWIEKSETDQPRVEKRMDHCATAVRYQMYHALALMIVGLMAIPKRCRGLDAAGMLISLGVVGFSGGLYLIVFADDAIHWAIVPTGGVLLLCGWLALAVSALWLKNDSKTTDA